MSQSFPDLGVSAPVVKALAARGITNPFPIQGLIMADALAGRDVLAKSQTGSGKTLAFAIPIVERLAPGQGKRPQALVLVPTRELASQVVREFEDVAAAKKLHVAARYTKNPVRREIEAPKRTVEEAQHRFVSVSEAGKVDALVELLTAEPGLALVFTRTKRGAGRLAERLEAKGISVAAMHGDLSQAARERTLKRFHSGKVSTLVATDVAARGLDVEGIAHVINYDPPADDTGYVHRVGRTARAGRSGRGVTLVTPEQQSDVSRMAARLHLSEDFKRDGMTIAPPRTVFSSKGRRAGMRRRPARRAF